SRDRNQKSRIKNRGSRTRHGDQKGEKAGAKGSDKSHSQSGTSEVSWKGACFQYPVPYETKTSSPASIRRDTSRRADRKRGLTTSRTLARTLGGGRWRCTNTPNPSRVDEESLGQGKGVDPSVLRRVPSFNVIRFQDVAEVLHKMIPYPPGSK